MSNSTYFAVSSVGKDRWYWVVWPSMQWQVDPTVSHLQDGYVPTKADAVDLALDAAGMNGVWMEAKYAREYHRAKAAPASKQRSAAPSVVEYLHRDVYDPVTGAWHSVRHRITRKTPKFVFVEATSVDLRDGVSGNDSVMDQHPTAWTVNSWRKMATSLCRSSMRW
ncbi:MAG: hypothetical protein HC802_03720 [Caldilineaceae bacterium]|nr:hypothetical protein [Caldilineaceae bacterium]